MASVSTLILALLSLCFIPIALAQPYSVCWNGDSDCPACQNDTSNLNFTALRVIEQYTGIISMEGLESLHTSLLYMCCYSQVQLETIVSVMRAYDWTTIYNISYSEIMCNLDHNNITIYITAKPDDAGQAALFQWAQGLQNAIAAAGVPVTHPRVQDFHMTLAKVNHTYPTDTLIAKLQNFDFGTVNFDWFELNGDIFLAKDSAKKLKTENVH